MQARMQTIAATGKGGTLEAALARPSNMPKTRRAAIATGG